MSRDEVDESDKDFPNPDDSCWTCDQSDARQESLMEAPDWFEMAGADDE